MLSGVILTALFIGYTLGDSDVEQLFKDTKVIPDVLNEAPKEKLKVEHENGLIVGDGIEYKPADTISAPTIDWPSADPKKYYAVYMCCPDAPDVKNPIFREVIHWLVVNVPGNQVDKGNLYCPYLGPIPPKFGGSMRYIYVVYEQPGKMEFDEKVINGTNAEEHLYYKINKFTEKYQLGQPVAGNVYRAQYDDSVPLSHKRIGLNLDE